LHDAAANGHSDIVAALLPVSGIEINVLSANGYTPLMLAALKDRVECVRVLVAAGAKTEIECLSDGMTAMHLAASAGHPEIIAALAVAPGINIDSVDNKGQTSLMIAAINGEDESAKALLAAGAKTDIKDQRGYDALLHARSNGSGKGHFKIYELLKDKHTEL
jgi:ankyrin repeat protein